MKKLPKAIRRTTDESTETSGKAPAAARAQAASARALKKSEAASESATDQADLVESAAVPLGPTAPVANDTAPATTRPAEIKTAQRRERANAIVKRHAAYAAVGGVMPLPIVSFAGVAAIILRMVKVLSDHYGVPFERERAQAIVIGMMGGAVPAGVGAVATSTLAFMLPSSILVSCAVSTVVAAAATRGIGRAFIEHFESGATLSDALVRKA